MMKNLMKFCLMLAFLLLSSKLFSQTGTMRVVDGKNYTVHIVKSGETLYKISKKYNVTVKQIQESNTMGEIIKPGDELLIPSASQELKEVEPSPVYKEHKVASGQTLSAIARDYGTTVDELKRINKLTSTGLKIGQVIKVPAGSSVASTPVESKPAEEAPEKKPAEPKVAVNKPADTKQPANPRNEKPATADSGKQNGKSEGGMPASAEVLAETATEKEEVATASVFSDRMEQDRTFVMHPTLPKGSIIVVVNENTGKMAYCRVVDNIKPSELNGASLAITKTVANKIGMKSNQGSVTIKYAAP
ncbi:MAG: DPBB and LysM peptidoglycan-binding domain-containing protein [Bacteroidia bacterium]|jgi:LysM repeat protein